MPYSGSGTFSIVNSFTPSSTISSSSVNANFTDIASGLSNTLTLDGQSAMTAPVKASNGTASAPSYTFGSDTNTGLYRKAADQVGVGCAGSEVGYFSSAGFTGAVVGNVTGNVTGSVTGAWAYMPSGTKALFQQTAAPTGWTKDTTHNNKALRVVSGTASSGGTTAFTDVFTARTIAEANLPAHTHAVTDPGHIHAFTSGGSSAGFTYSDQNRLTAGTPINTASATTGITIGNTGSGTAMDFAVQYVDVIVATKD